MNKKLMTSYSERNKVERYKTFEIIENLPEIGDSWQNYGNEVVAIHPLRLDSSEGNRYQAYVIAYVNRGCDDECENPFIAYVAIDSFAKENDDE